MNRARWGRDRLPVAAAYCASSADASDVETPHDGPSPSSTSASRPRGRNSPGPSRRNPRSCAPSTIRHAFMPSSGSRRHGNTWSTSSSSSSSTAPLSERTAPEIAVPALEHVERDEHRGGAHDPGVRVTEQMEAAHQILVIHRHFAAEHNDVELQLRDRTGELTEPIRVVDSVARDQTDAATILVREDAPAINFLFVDPAVAMERRAHERGRHGTSGSGTTNTAPHYASGRTPSVAAELVAMVPHARV